MPGDSCEFFISRTIEVLFVLQIRLTLITELLAVKLSERKTISNTSKDKCHLGLDLDTDEVFYMQKSNSTPSNGRQMTSGYSESISFHPYLDLIEFKVPSRMQMFY